MFFGEYSPVSGCGVENCRLARVRHKRKLGKMGSKSPTQCHPPRSLRYDTKSVLKSMNAKKDFASIYQIYVGYYYGENSPVSGCVIESCRLARVRHKRKLGKLGTKSLRQPPRSERYDT
jgi:hypothetical protein